MKFIDLLLEGKKENLIDKYKGSATFVDAPELLEKLIDGDPSATKKYSEWLIKQMISLGDPSRYSLADNINLFIDLIEEFNKSVTSITPEDIDYADSISSLVNPEKVKSGPKDINKYDSIWGLQAVLTAVRKRREEKEKEEAVKGEVEKLYEDDRFLIVEPHTHGASCYYGANTKWCTTTKDSPSYFNRYSEEGSLYYVIDKKSDNRTFGKMALFVRSNGNTEVYDQQDAIRSIDVLFDRFEPIKDEIKKLVKGNKHYETLLKIQEGTVDPSRGKVNSPLIKMIGKVGDGEYKVVFNFGGVKNFLELFKEEVDESDLSYIEYTIDPGYGSEERFYDPYTFDDDLSEGYVLNYFTNEHLEVLKKILNVYDPKVSELITETPDGYFYKDGAEKEIGEFILEKFPQDFVDDFKYAYSYAYDDAIAEGAKEAFTDGLCNILSEIGFDVTEKGNCFYTYDIDLKELLNLYESEEYLTDLSVGDMLQHVVSNRVSFPYEYPSESVWENFDNETFTGSFNDEMLKLLEKEYDKFDDAEYIKDFDEYLRVLEDLKKEFTIGENTPVPAAENVFVNVEGVDYETNKVKFTLKRFNPDTDRFETRKGKSKLSSLISLMNNYQLFDPFE